MESLDYADDKCELSHKKSDQQAKLDDLASESAKVGQRINIFKSKEMRINPESNVPLTLNNQPIECVQEFQYLGSMVGRRMWRTGYEKQEVSAHFLEKSGDQLHTS
mgnify:CR=1 FL=1